VVAISKKRKKKSIEYLPEFVDPSKIHESIFIGYLWRTPQLYEKYKLHNIKSSTFTEQLWFFLFYIGREMYNNGIRSFDDITVYSFLTSRPKEEGKKSWFEYYNENGGYSLIEDLIVECDSDKENDEYHFSEIQKYESLRMAQEEGIIDVEDKELISKLTKMTLKQLQSFFQYKTNKIFSHINCGEVVEYNFLDNLDRTIERLNEGEGMGLELHNSPRLNKLIKGWRKGQLLYLVLSSGVGKSSICIEKFVLSLIKNNEKGMFFANEEDIFKNQGLLLATVANSVLRDYVTREKLSEGNFDKETLDKLEKSKEWLNQFNKDLIKFYDMQKYRVKDVISRLNLMKPLGYNYAILDTFKPDLSGKEEARWLAFSNAAQEIYDCIKVSANNIGMLATVQLKIGKEYRYLDLSVIGKALEIVEVASVVMIGRLLYADEMPGGKHQIFAYNWEKDELTDEWYKKEYELDKDKTYLILFLPKNRFGPVDRQILYEVNYDFNTFHEVAYVKMGRTSNTAF
jgi:replicative DNA helicase